MVFGSTKINAQTSGYSDKDKAVRELLVVSGTADMQVSAVEAMIPQLRQMYPTLPEEFFTKFQAEIQSGSLTNALVDVYKKHFTLEEVNELIKFYKSDIGQVLIQKQPIIMQESMEVGRKWGGEAAERIAGELNLGQGQ